MNSTPLSKTTYYPIINASILCRIIAAIIDLAIIITITTPTFIKNFNSYIIIIIAFLEFLYYILFIYYFERTFGMMIMRIRVVSTCSKNISFKQAFIRFISSKFSRYFLELGNIWCVFNDSRQTFQDIAAQTIVIYNKNSKSQKEHFHTYPWGTEKKLLIFKIIIISLGFIMSTISILDFLVNTSGNLGFIKICSYNQINTIFDIKAYKLNNNTPNTLATLEKDNSIAVLNLYKLKNKNLCKENSYEIENFNLDMLPTNISFKIDDINNDNIDELIVSANYVSNNTTYSKLSLYKKNINSFSFVTNIADFKINNAIFKSNLETFRDEHGTFHILWLNRDYLTSFVYTDNAFKQEFQTIVYFNSTIFKGDFDEKNEENIYLAEQYSKDSGLIINKLNYKNNALLESPFKQITKNIDFIPELWNSNMFSSDINADSKNEFIINNDLKANNSTLFFDSTPINSFNIYSSGNNNFNKIWVGGKISKVNQFKFKTSFDINDDNQKEIILSNDDENNHINKIVIYKQQAFLMKLNNLWIKILNFYDSLIFYKN